MTLQVLRRRDGAHLVTVNTLVGGGWVAQTLEGGVDGPERGREAMLTFTEGPEEHGIRGYGWQLARDRFHLPGLLERAAGGEATLPVGVEPGPVSFEAPSASR